MSQPHSATRLIHAAEGAAGDAAPLTTPVYASTTFVFESAAEVVAYNEGRSSKFLYSRYENPTVVAVERQLGALDGAEAALLFASGMAAVSAALLTFVSAGDEVVCAASVYGGTLHLLTDLLARFGVAARFVSVEALARPSEVVGPRTRVLWFESPTNPTLRCVDVAAVGEACRAHGVVSVLDNTFATPINQRPLALGVDLAMQSATKYLNGHSDVMAGALTGRAALIGRVVPARRLLGGILDPSAASLVGRGLKTLPLRMARHNENARHIAEFLAQDRRVATVYYPGLVDHPDHAVAARQMQGFGGMVCFDVDGRFERAAGVFDRLRLIKRAASLGGVESLVSLPVLTSQWGHSDEQLRAAGVTKGMLRLSVGLEDPADLVADLDQALG